MIYIALLPFTLPADAFARAKIRGEAALIPFICGGYHNADMTISILLAMQRAGADMIELGVPCSNPWADGPTLKNSHLVAVQNGTRGVRDCLKILKDARSKGLVVPVILMGYHTSFEEEYEEYSYSLDQMCREAAASGADGFLSVGINEGKQERAFNMLCYKHKLSNIQLVMPTATEERINKLVSMASTFLYIVSVNGKTGARDSLPATLGERIAHVRSKTSLPLVVGFGISSPEMVAIICNSCDGAVIGSFLTDCLDRKGDHEEAEDVIFDQVSRLHSGTRQTSNVNQATKLSQVPLHIDNRNMLMLSFRARHGGGVRALRVTAAFAA